MSVAELAARVLMPFLFFGWGFVLVIPKEFEEPRDPRDSWWQRPQIFTGILAVAVGCIAFMSGGAHGDIATLVVLLAVVPMAPGAALSLWLRRRPSRSSDR